MAHARMEDRCEKEAIVGVGVQVCDGVRADTSYLRGARLHVVEKISRAGFGG